VAPAPQGAVVHSVVATEVSEPCSTTCDPRVMYSTVHNVRSRITSGPDRLKSSAGHLCILIRLDVQTDDLEHDLIRIRTHQTVVYPALERTGEGFGT
jgi:hypothetical protein